MRHFWHWPRRKEVETMTLGRSRDEEQSTTIVEMKVPARGQLERPELATAALRDSVESRIG